MSELCVRCKGVKHLCGRPVCPILLKMKSFENLDKLLEENELIGESPSIFIGRYNYPNVFIGPLTGKNPSLEENTEKWLGTPLTKIIQHRTSLFRGKDVAKVTEAASPSKKLEAVQEIAMSKKNIDTDVVFKKKPKLEVGFDSVTAPFGPTGETRKVIIESNPIVPRAVDKVVNDELKAVEGMKLLYEKGVSFDSIQRILSVGLLGLKKKLVPTRWSITATDDTLGKQLLAEVKEYPELNDYLVFESNYLDNHFFVLFLPGKWSFEQIEFYSPGSIWVKKNEDVVFMEDYELFQGRKKYAENVQGGYYAGRLAVLEKLRSMRRQATAFVVREIGSGYWAPVGVWEVRENVRNAVKGKSKKFASLEEALAFIGSNLQTNREWEKHSELLKTIRGREIFKSYFY